MSVKEKIVQRVGKHTPIECCIHFFNEIKYVWVEVILYF